MSADPRLPLGPMHLALHHSACGRRLSAVLTGPVSYADRRDALDLVCRTGVAHRIAQYLIDFTTSWHVVEGPHEKAEFFHALRDRAELAGARVAYVNCPEGNLAELHAAARDVGFEAGVFRTRSAAIEWLEGTQVTSLASSRPAAIG